MSDDDLVKQLRYLGDHASYEPDMYHTAADRIASLTEQLEDARLDAKEAEAYSVWLEGKLAKAVKAMQEAIKLADMPHYGDRENALDNCFDAIDLLRTTLSELNGDKP